jgi:uncharacterized protein YcbX
MPTIAALHVYPVKSCRGIALTQADLTPRGLRHDREWMVVTPEGRFLTQRELPRLALIAPGIADHELQLQAPGAGSIAVALDAGAGPSREVTVWDDTVLARDEGDAVARWLSDCLRRSVRLVRFDPSRRRATDPAWSAGRQGESAFSDGYPVLVLSRASLSDLNARLSQPLPLDRFRPNLVLDGCDAYAEDSLRVLQSGTAALRLVKPCTRCIITTTDQSTAARDGEEPLRTLRSYRWSSELRGVTFGQNAIVESVGTLRVGDAISGSA